MKIIFPFLISLLLTITSLLMHVSEDANSMLNSKSTELSHEFLFNMVEYHKTQPAFAKRPLTTYLIEHTSTIFHVKTGEAFVLVNFFPRFFVIKSPQ